MSAWPGIKSSRSTRFALTTWLFCTLGGRGTWRMLAEARNLLAEHDIYRRYEFTFLRQLVSYIREVTTKHAISAYLLGFYTISSCKPVAEKPVLDLLNDKQSSFL